MKEMTDEKHLQLALKEREHLERCWQESLKMFEKNKNEDTRIFVINMMEKLNMIDWNILKLGYTIKEKKEYYELEKSKIDNEHIINCTNYLKRSGQIPLSWLP